MWKGASAYRYLDRIYVVPKLRTVPAAGPLCGSLDPVGTALVADPVDVGAKVVSALRESIDGYPATSWKDLPPCPLYALLGEREDKKLHREAALCDVVTMDERRVRVTPMVRVGVGAWDNTEECDRLAVELVAPIPVVVLGKAVLAALEDADRLTQDRQRGGGRRSRRLP